MSRDALLSDLRVLVVDLQATGAAPDKGSIVELGWAFTAADGVLRDAEAHWVELPEDATVPTIVRRLLGLPSLSAAGPGASEGALSRCGEDRIKRAEAAMDSAFRSALADMPGEAAKKVLAEEQTAWAAFREKSCLMFSSGDFPRDIRAVSFAVCRAGVIEARAKYLKGLTDN